MARKRGAPEAILRRHIRDGLKALNFAVYDLEQQRPTRQTPGLPDLYVQGHGMTFWVEVKTENGRLSQAQRQFRLVEELHGGIVHLWRSVTDLKAWWESST